MSVIHQEILKIPTQGRQTVNITSRIQKIVDKHPLEIGLCHLFIRHTSASLIICENADPDVREDLEHFLSRLVPDGSSLFSHQTEGPDDMPAHIRTLLTQTHLTLPIQQNKLLLGTWQGIYLYEHRVHAFTREVVITLQA